ncbi:MAG: MBL fold metallo-hydrolase [Tepidimonas sp.]|uniref:MBL fold metallo-hydrolase n=1 Tax=Tepidimonas sp. TaxID=2002775 RepID=UPI00259F765E|nr:MBL fold metallo-hydrolase [Tepidimonas sp.]MDM7457161.1 MBL fold metallo-hydrolase [Tepidimonas sp.]
MSHPTLPPGVRVFERGWLSANKILAAPGHDPDAVMLFEPASRTLICGDALWAHGFGVVFPELEGEPGFDAVAATLTLIERLAPRVVIPGHGSPFGDAEYCGAGPAEPVASALAVARQRLQSFAADPARHRRHALKVLLKFKPLQWQRQPLAAVYAWAQQVPLLLRLHARCRDAPPFAQWLDAVIDDLCANQAARRVGDMLVDGT